MKYVVVKDVFIPQKRRRVTNSRFGSVRFDCAVAAQVAVQRANGLWVDDKAIKVKLVEFGRETVKEGPSYFHQSKPLIPTVEAMNRKNAFVVRKSYAEAVKGVTGVGVGRCGLSIIKGEEIGNRWLYESVIVHLKTIFTDINLEKELEERGIADVVVRKGGGRDVVLSFKSKEEMNSKMEVIRERPGLVMKQEQRVWLSCNGIPLNLWNRTNFTRIGSIWGEVFYLDKDLCQPKSFDCARIMILTSSMEQINKVINSECNGILHHVRVSEDQIVVAQSSKDTCSSVSKNQQVLVDDHNSSNGHGQQNSEERNRGEEENADRDDESAKELDHNLELARGEKAHGKGKYVQLDKDSNKSSETKVAESRSALAN
ncbi:hypothetical protein ACSBR2_015550 [Camellia fascicularis]